MSQDRFRIDSHKLMYHPQRVTDWMGGKNIYPIYVEISPSGACNHRCTFCSVDFMGYQKRYIETEVLRKTMREMASLGVKSVMFAGEGEPFIHKDLPELIVDANQHGIDIGITTNGTLLKPKVSEMILKHTEWIKVSCNAGTPESYEKIHQTNKNDFNKVMDNLREAVRIRKEQNARCTIGLQTVLLPENAEESLNLARCAVDVGVDYLVIKPYTVHHKNKHDFQIMYDKYENLKVRLEEYNNDNFHVIFRINAMSKWDRQERDYVKCNALPFWAYVEAGGNVIGCGAHLGEEAFTYGNIYKQSFQEIWDGEERKQKMEKFNKDFCIEGCKINCRMDEVNRYLWELKNPIEHVNFI